MRETGNYRAEASSLTLRRTRAALIARRRIPGRCERLGLWTRLRKYDFYQRLVEAHTVVLSRFRASNLGSHQIFDISSFLLGWIRACLFPQEKLRGGALPPGRT